MVNLRTISITNYQTAELGKLFSKSSNLAFDLRENKVNIKGN